MPTWSTGYENPFYHASLGGEHLKMIVEDIGKLEKSEFDSKLSTQYDEKFQLVLIAVFLLALIELMLGERRTSFRLWRGRFEVPQQ